MHITTGMVVTGAVITGVELRELLLISEGRAHASYVATSRLPCASETDVESEFGSPTELEEVHRSGQRSDHAALVAAEAGDVEGLSGVECL